MRRQLGWLCVLPALAATLTPTPAAAASGVSFTAAMQAASQTRSVPLPLIEATAYVNSRWQWIATPAAGGGVGPMHVTPPQMAKAVALSGHSQAAIIGDLSANIDAGAALLANAHTSGTDLASWEPAVATLQGPFVSTQIFDALRSGQTATASTGEQVVLSPQALPSSKAPAAPNAPAGGATAPATATTTDQTGATWVPADLNNFSWGNRAHDYPVNMIIIHDAEGTYGSTIQLFQDPTTAASAHYVVSDQGQITQMVLEHDIAWHAGNWDYNTRSIGIEHEGYAYAQPTWYTPAMYNASAYLIASICSRWGVPMDRNHVIGHYQVPDPNNPGLYGGTDHHTDPGPYWDWTLYMNQAVHYASTMPSPPRMGPDPVAVNGLTDATITWQAAQTCTKPITGYTVTSTPATQTMNLPATATSATFSNLTPGTSYTFTVTATDADGTDNLTTNAVVPGRCATNQVTAAPASPQRSGTAVQLTATSTGCPNPQYQFFTQAPGSSTWQLAQAYSSTATFTLNTAGQPSGVFNVAIWARDANSPGNVTDSAGTYDTRTNLAYTFTPAYCASVTASTAPPTSSVAGAPVAVTGAAAGCPSPRYQFWMLPPGSSTWQMVQDYSANATYSWITTGRAMGTYQFSVWARDASSLGANTTGLGTYDVFAGVGHTLSPAVCSGVTESAAPPSPAASGTPVTITGVASGCPSPLYEFWMLAQGSSTWRIVQGYSTNASYQWNSTGALAGTEQFGVWVRDASSNASYDAYTGIPYAVTTPSCTSVTISAAPASPSVHGTGVQVTFTGSAAGCSNANPQYEFWMLAQGSSTWQLLRGYSTNATYSWNTNGAPAGTERFGVWVRDASSSAQYDSYVGINYSLA